MTVHQCAEVPKGGRTTIDVSIQRGFEVTVRFVESSAEPLPKLLVTKILPSGAKGDLSKPGYLEWVGELRPAKPIVCPRVPLRITPMTPLQGGKLPRGITVVPSHCDELTIVLDWRDGALFQERIESGCARIEGATDGMSLVAKDRCGRILGPDSIARLEEYLLRLSEDDQAVAASRPAREIIRDPATKRGRIGGAYPLDPPVAKAHFFRLSTSQFSPRLLLHGSVHFDAELGAPALAIAAEELRIRNAPESVRQVLLEDGAGSVPTKAVATDSGKVDLYFWTAGGGGQAYALEVEGSLHRFRFPAATECESRSIDFAEIVNSPPAAEAR